MLQLQQTMQRLLDTKDTRFVRYLGMENIRAAVDRFIAFVQEHPELTFLVTPIGCGIAGYTPEDIAPLFAAAKTLNNVHLPESFWKHITE